MNYQETWDIANAIGYHHARMVKEKNRPASNADLTAFDALLQQTKPEWQNTAIRAYDAGILEGNQS